MVFEANVKTNDSAQYSGRESYAQERLVSVLMSLTPKMAWIVKYFFSWQ
ncbi:hypothetical protein [Teredinibacter turnerae]|nr:hypothetical protein [Teredinibacter turnerae]